MLLVNQKPLESYPKDHPFRQEYEDGIRRIREDFEGKKFVHLKQSGHPVKDSEGKNFPVPPVLIPLRTNVSVGKTGKNEWAYCATMPKLLPNGLYEVTQRNKMFGAYVVLDFDQDIDFAYYMLRISNAFKSGMLVVDDPGLDARKRGKEKREKLMVESIIWQELNDDDELRLVASAWGLSNAYDKEPDLLREELESELHRREKLRKNDESVKGIEAFIGSMKDRDSLRGQSLLQRAVDNGDLKYEEKDRRYMIGTSEVLTVPLREADRPFAYLCRRLESDNKEYVRVLSQVMTKEMIDAMSDYKDIQWLAKTAGLTYVGRKKDEITKEVKDAFCG